MSLTSVASYSISTYSTVKVSGVCLQLMRYMHASFRVDDDKLESWLVNWGFVKKGQVGVKKVITCYCFGI